MSLGDRVWETFTTVIQMKDKIAALADTVKTQQSKIEDLTGRVIRLETALAMMMSRPVGAPRLPDK
ncbi:MAG TPA: hypothetical protein VKA43_16825 [Gammaproteobacteria bacterium]|jgi:hypothetical protein|nr:hypothetical protein [Gammaproteobacteria bacterium]